MSSAKKRIACPKPLLVAPLFAAPLFAALLYSFDAGASGFQLFEQNGSGTGSAYAGSAAVAEDASTIFYNPAGMMELQAKKWHMSLGGALIQTSMKFQNDGSSVGSLKGNGGDAGSLALVPNGYISTSLGENWAIGLGVGGPFGLASHYDNPWMGAAQSIQFGVKAYNINPSVAWRASDKLSFGFGLDVQRLEASYRRAVGTASVLPGITADANLQSDGFGWNTGVLYKPVPGTKLGLSYRSAIRHTLSGDISLFGRGSSAATANALAAAGGASDVKGKVTLPGTAILSLAQKINPKTELLADVSWTGWDSISRIDLLRTSGKLSGQTAQTLDTDFRDTWRFALGAHYALTNAWKLKFGTAYDQTPVKNAERRMVSLPDNDRVWLAMGTQWQARENVTVDVGLARLFMAKSGINNDQRSATATSNRGLVKGRYDVSAWILGTQVAIAF